MIQLNTILHAYLPFIVLCVGTIVLGNFIAIVSFILYKKKTTSKRCVSNFINFFFYFVKLYCIFIFQMDWFSWNVLIVIKLKIMKLV
jgi:hypothetical protein